MKKTSYHVNPAVNKWEEEQRRARMEKMIQRAKSTLPPEARGGSKTSGPKKPSPYSAENNAAKAMQKRSTGGQGTPAGAAAMDVQELDSLIYNRVQEILGTPLMRRAAAARAASKGATTQKTPQSGRGGRRPAWNDDWNAQMASPPAKHEERCIGDVGARRGTSNPPYERSSSKSTTGSTRAGPTNTHTGTPTKGKRIPAPTHIDIPVSGIGTGMPLQRRPGARIQTTEERVILLPSPSPVAAATKGPMARPASSRYGSAAGALAGGEAVEPPHGASGHLLEQSMVAAIEALNPQALGAREAASRIAQNQQSHGKDRLGSGPDALPSGAGSIGGVSVTASSSYHSHHDRMGAKRLSDSVSGGGAAGVGSRDASLMQSLAAAAGVSQGVLATTSVTNSSSRRPPLAPAQRASGRGIPQAPQCGRLTSKRRDDEEEDDAYSDDDFEEYDSTEDEHQHSAQRVEPDSNNEDGFVARESDSGAGGVAPDIALLRDSVNALNELVQLKIQHELARSQQQQLVLQEPVLNRQSFQAGRLIDPGEQRQVPPAEMLASLALVGSEEPDSRGVQGPGRVDPTMSSLGDGLRQSDLDYLARLGGGEPHEGLEVAASTDERPFMIEPGAPAGTIKAWGDRHAWATENGADSGATGLEKLRARQDRERQQQGSSAGTKMQSQQGVHGEARLSLKESERTTRMPGSASGAAAAQGDEDSVLLGETFTPRHRTGPAAQMQAVSNTLAVLASSGQLSSGDAQELRNQTDALYGSLVQLHDLMNGPRGVELCSSSPSSGGGRAAGFTPTALSPEDSPSQSLRRRAGTPQGSVEGYPAKPMLQRTNNLGEGESISRPKPAGGTEGPGGASSHLELTPKHRLVAEDVAWMAGLMQSLSKSLQVDNGEVTMLGL